MRVRSVIPAVTTLVALAACTPDVPANDLAVGECVEDGDAFADEANVLEVPTIDCDELHLYEVFALPNYPDADEYPGDDTVEQESQDLCLDAVEGYVGVPAEQADYQVRAVYPSQDTWDAGDRVVICLLESPEPAEGSARDSGTGAGESE